MQLIEHQNAHAFSSNVNAQHNESNFINYPSYLEMGLQFSNRVFSIGLIPASNSKFYIGVIYHT
jgi:hypothetical protein